MPLSEQQEIYAHDRLEVARIVRNSGSSFYWGMRFLRPQQRFAMYSIYAFCRILDDIADGDSDKIALSSHSENSSIDFQTLHFWKEEIERIFSKEQCRTSISRELAIAVREYNLLKEDLWALISGMEMDLNGPIFAPTCAELDLYCARVAGVVGHLSTRIFGIPPKAGKVIAYHLGRALQLTNILRDVEPDSLSSRLYLPKELLLKHQVPIDGQDIDQILSHPHIKLVCQEIYQQAFAHFKYADYYMNNFTKEQKRPMRLMAIMYKKILQKMEKRGLENFHQKVRLTKFEKIRLVLQQVF